MRETLFGFPVSYREIEYEFNDHLYSIQYEEVQDNFDHRYLEIPRLLINMGFNRTAFEYCLLLRESVRNWETSAELHLISAESLYNLGDYEGCLLMLSYTVIFSTPRSRMVFDAFIYVVKVLANYKKLVLFFDYFDDIGKHPEINYFNIFRRIGRMYETWSEISSDSDARDFWMKIVRLYYEKAIESMPGPYIHSSLVWK